mmetsp:Transcript_115397/g.326138  ORF Transcript_115397/g.326138 Transcript_115397/m.326138 type:complete len:234 (-) Transcript_115397:174-875(-)
MGQRGGCCIFAADVVPLAGESSPAFLGETKGIPTSTAAAMALAPSMSSAGTPMSTDTQTSPVALALAHVESAAVEREQGVVALHKGTPTSNAAFMALAHRGSSTDSHEQGGVGQRRRTIESPAASRSIAGNKSSDTVDSTGVGWSVSGTAFLLAFASATGCLWARKSVPPRLTKSMKSKGASALFCTASTAFDPRIRVAPPIACIPCVPLCGCAPGEPVESTLAGSCVSLPSS